MAQRIITDCDMHAAHDEIVDGRTFDIAIRRQGESFQFLSVDLCDDDAKGLADLFVELAGVGRTFDDAAAAVLGSAVGVPSKRKRGPARAARTPSSTHAAPVEGQPSEQDAENDDGRWECPSCEMDYADIGKLRAHVRSVHETNLATLLGIPTPYQCPTCPNAFTTPQGLAVHRTRTHGYRIEHES